MKENQIVPLNRIPIENNSDEPTDTILMNPGSSSSGIKLPPLELEIMNGQSKIMSSLNSSPKNLKSGTETPMDTEELSQKEINPMGYTNPKQILSKHSRNLGGKESTTAFNTDLSGTENLSSSEGLNRKISARKFSDRKLSGNEQEDDNDYQRSLSKDKASKAFYQNKEKRKGSIIRDKMKSTKDILLENRIEI